MIPLIWRLRRFSRNTTVVHDRRKNAATNLVPRLRLGTHCPRGSASQALCHGMNETRSSARVRAGGACQVARDQAEPGHEDDALLQPQARAWLRRRLLAWFARHARILPWRSSRDPYVIWISEVMLQQTQVVTVIPFFERFLQAFPNIAALAEADEQQVLRLWEGLGYYRRARDMHRTARILKSDHGGTIPHNADHMRPAGPGPLHRQRRPLASLRRARLPILEANSVRVLCRLLGIVDDPRKGEVRSAGMRRRYYCRSSMLANTTRR